MNMAQLAEDNIRKFGEHVSLIFEDQEFTNVEMDRAARKLANALRGIGVKRGTVSLYSAPILRRFCRASRRYGR